LLNILKSDDKLVLKSAPASFKLNDYLLPFLDDYSDSRFFSYIGENKEWIYSHEKLVINLHDWGIYLADYIYNRQELRDFYKIITYEEDDHRRFLVTAIEAFDYPIYGVQFHPERTFFRFSDKDNYTRSAEARMLSEDLIFYFVEEARKNQHYFETQEDLDKHMYGCQRKTYGYIQSTGEFIQPILVDSTCLGYD